MLHIVATRGVRAVVPLVLAASRRTELAGLRMVDGQVQGDGAVATLRCLEQLHSPLLVYVLSFHWYWLQAVALNSLVLG